MGVAAQEVRRNRVLVTLLAVCLILAAILQLNGRSIFAIGEAQGKDGVFATLVQPNPKGAVGVVTPATGPIGRLLESAGRSFGNPRAVAGRAPAGEPGAGTPASSGTTDLAIAGTPDVVPGASSGGGSIAGGGPASGGLPRFGGILAPFVPVSGPSGPVAGITPTPQPTPTPNPSATPTPEPSATPPANPSPTPTQPAINPSPTPTAPVIDPTPQPTPPVIDPTPGPTPPVTEPTPPFPTPTPPITDPTGPVSPVPEPAAWALWLLGFGLIGGLVRWRRRAIHAVAAEDVGGDAA